MSDFDWIDPRLPPSEDASAAHIRMNVAGQQVQGPSQNPVPPAIGEVSDVKEAYASSIARIITWTFAACAVLLLLGMFLVALIRPAQADQLLNKDMGLTLVGVGTFLSSVFGPLLAFVLGYYFGERGKKT